MHTGRELVVVRCGDASLHSAWLDGKQTWDFAVSYFGEDDTISFPRAKYVHRYVGGKWDGLAAFFAANPSCLDDYDFFWFPDDDIATDALSIDRLFATVRRLGLELAQPSLARGSFLSHLVSLNNPAFLYRHVNLIEIMVPILDRRMLCKLLPLFATTKSGFGIDFVWQRFTTDPRTRVAVIDSVAVTHTRPVGGPLRSVVAAGRSSVEQEQELFLRPYGNVRKTEVTLGGRLRVGLVIRSSKVAATAAALGWAAKPFGNRGFRASISAAQFLVWVGRNWYGSVSEDWLPMTTLATPLAALKDDALT